MIDATHSVLSPAARAEAPSLRFDEAARAPSVETTGFAGVLTSLVGEVNATQEASSAMTSAFARGAIDDVHGTMIAMKEAEISLRLVGSIRNKLVDAFQELWRTNV